MKSLFLERGHTVINDYFEAIEQLVDAIEAKLAEHGVDAPASANLRKDVGIITPCSLGELLVEVQKSLARTNALKDRVERMQASSFTPHR